MIFDHVTIYQGFPQPLCQGQQFAKVAHRAQKNTSLTLPVYCEGYNSGTARWKRCRDQGNVGEDGHNPTTLTAVLRMEHDSREEVGQQVQRCLQQGLRDGGGTKEVDRFKNI